MKGGKLLSIWGFKIRFKENNKDRKLLKKIMNERKKDRKENDT